MKVKWFDEDWGYRTKFIFFDDVGPGYARHVVSDIRGGRCTLEKIEPGAAITEPTLDIDGRSATELIQSFLDEAWEKGFRPTKEKRTREQVEKEMARLEAHLEDMRRLVFEPQQQDIQIKVKE
jgi:hypothetical protein